MGFKEKVLEVQGLLEQVNSVLEQQKVALNDVSAAIEKYSRSAKIPSDFHNAQKAIKDQEQVRAELQKTLDANNNAVAKKKAQMAAMFADAEAKRKKDLASQEAKTAKEIALYEKTAKAEIDANNKRIQSAEKRAAKEAEIEERKASRIIAANERLAAKQASIDARNSRTGASSVIPGMGAKISDLKETERLALANEKLNRAYVQLTARRNEAKNRLQDLIASEKASNAEIRIAQKEFDILDKRVQKANKAVGQFSMQGNNINKLSTGISSLMGAFGISTGLYLGASIIKDIYDTTKQLQSLDLALKMVSDTQDNYAANTIFLTAISEKWGLEIKATTEQFIKFYADAKGKLSELEIKETFEGIAKAGSIMGLSLEKQQSAFTAFQQMLSKGTIQAQELKLQLGDALPGSIKVATAAYQKLHPELKVTEALLYKHMEQGKLISTEMIPLMVKGYQELYGIENVNNINTLTSAQNRLSNSWTELIRAMDTANQNTVAGQFLQGLIKNSERLLNYLTRILSTIDQINAKKITQGQTEAVEAFANEDIESNPEYASADRAGRRAFLQKRMDEAYADWKYSVDAYNELAAKYNAKNSVGRYWAIALKSEMESRSKSIGNFKEMYSQYKSFLESLDPKKIKAPSIGESEKERKERLKREKEFLDAAEKLRKDRYAREISDLQRQKELIKDARDIEKESLENKIFLENAYAFKEIQIAKRVRDEEVMLAKGSADLIAIAENNYLTEKENAISESQARIKALTDKFNKEQIDKTEQWYKENPPMFTESKEQSEAREKLESELKRMKDLLQEFFQETEQGFFSEAGFEKTYDMFGKLDEKGKTTFENLIKAAKKADEEARAAGERTYKQFGVVFQGITESAQEAFNFMSEASNKNFETEYDNLERRRDVALDFAGQSESAREEIERQFEAKRREIRKREWKAQQQMALFNIAIDTAQAVVASVAKSPLTFGLPFSAFALAIGAVQAGVVASQRMPEFWRGTDNAPEGWAWTQERGREVILDKSGNLKSMGSDKGPQATYLNAGDRVLSNPKTMDFLDFATDLNNILSNNNIGMPVPDVKSGAMTEEQVSRIVNSIDNAEGVQIISDGVDIIMKLKRRNELIEKVNRRVEFKSKFV